MKCETCGGELTRDVAELALAAGRRRTVLAQAGWYCWQCGGARFSATDLELAERQMREADMASRATTPAPRPAKAA